MDRISKHFGRTQSSTDIAVIRPFPYDLGISYKLENREEVVLSILSSQADPVAPGFFSPVKSDICGLQEGSMSGSMARKYRYSH